MVKKIDEVVLMDLRTRFVTWLCDQVERGDPVGYFSRWLVQEKTGRLKLLERNVADAAKGNPLVSLNEFTGMQTALATSLEEVLSGIIVSKANKALAEALHVCKWPAIKEWIWGGVIWGPGSGQVDVPSELEVWPELDSTDEPETRTVRSSIFNLYIGLMKIVDRKKITIGEKEIEETIDIHVFHGPVAHINRKWGTTINIGDFQSVRTDASLSLPCYPEEIDIAWAFAEEFLDARMVEEVRKVQGKGPLVVRQSPAGEVSPAGLPDDEVAAAAPSRKASARQRKVDDPGDKDFFS